MAYPILLRIVCVLSVLNIARSLVGNVDYAPEGEGRYLVSMWIFSGYDMAVRHCAGAALDRITVLTAAHCFMTPNITKVEILYVLDNSNTGKITVKDPESIVIHKEFVFPKKNDIALIRLPDAMEVRPGGVKFVEIPFFATPVGTRVTAYGRRFRFMKLEPLQRLLKTTFSVLNVTQIDPEFEEFLIIGRNKSSGTCIYDSGGPIVLRDHFLVGIVSKDDQDHIFSCQEGSNNLFTNVSNYLSWINENL